MVLKTSKMSPHIRENWEQKIKSMVLILILTWFISTDLIAYDDSNNPNGSIDFENIFGARNFSGDGGEQGFIVFFHNRSLERLVLMSILK